MKASDARQKALNNLKGVVIDPWMDYIHAAIDAHAEAGRFSMTHPFMDRKQEVGRASPQYPTPEMQKAIRSKLEAEGYTWTDHDDPDPGDVRGGAYSKIDWTNARDGRVMKLVPVSIQDASAIEQTLKFCKDEEGKSQMGYFSPPGWAGSQLTSLLERINAAPEI